MTFKTDFHDNKKRIITEKIRSVVTILDNLIQFDQEFYADFVKGDDEGMPPINELFSALEIQKRSSITGACKFWYYIEKVWGVKIYSIGAEYDMEPCFREEDEANNFLKTVIEWAFK